MRNVSWVAAFAVVVLIATILGATASGEPGPRGAWGRRSISLLSAKAMQRLVSLDVRFRGAGRWLIYVDGRFNGFSAGTTGFARVTRPGRHRIYVALAGKDNVALRPLVRSRTVDVMLSRPDGPVVAAAGDIACDPNDVAFNEGRGMAHRCHQGATSNLLVNAGLTAVLALGDLQYYCGAGAAFMYSYDQSWGRVKAITYPAPGNHEYQLAGGYGCAAGAQGYFTYWGTAAGDPSRGYYSFDIGPWHLVSLNSNCDEVGGCGPGSPEERWLRADLAAHAGARCTLAYWHHPPFSSRVTQGGTPMTITLLQDLYAAGVEVLLNGHEHNYERFAPQSPAGLADPARGIREFVVGTGGEDLRPFGAPIANSEVRQDDTFGVLELTLLPTSYASQFIPEGGGAFTDSGSSPCH
jgi:acid phosphatase type 7